MTKRTLFVLFIILTLFSTTIYAKDKGGKPTNMGGAIFVMANPLEIKVTEEVIKKDNEKSMVDLHIPKLEGLTDKKFQKKINKTFKDRARMLEKQVQKKSEQHTDRQGSKLKYEVTCNYKINKSNDHYLTVGLFDYVYEAGSHGIATETYHVIDIAENKVLTLDQLFEDGVDYKAIIIALINKQIAERTKQGQIFYDDVMYALEQNLNERFYITTNNDLAIVFNVYEIAPYGSGSIRFILPKEALNHYKLNN